MYIQGKSINVAWLAGVPIYTGESKTELLKQLEEELEKHKRNFFFKPEEQRQTTIADSTKTKEKTLFYHAEMARILLSRADEFSVRWIQQFDSLRQFRMKYGHCNVPHTGEYRTLGYWVVNQRRKRRKGKMPVDQIRLLDSLGFSWGKPSFINVDVSKNRVSP